MQQRLHADLLRPASSDSRYLGVRVKPVLEASRMRIAVVTSSPPMVEGGHMVIARALAQALREAGHDGRHRRHAAESVRAAGAAYLATWLTDVGVERRAADRPGDQPALSELRRPASAPRVLAESHDARVLRPVASRSARR